MCTARPTQSCYRTDLGPLQRVQGRLHDGLQPHTWQGIDTAWARDGRDAVLDKPHMPADPRCDAPQRQPRPTREGQRGGERCVQCRQDCRHGHRVAGSRHAGHRPNRQQDRGNCLEGREHLRGQNTHVREHPLLEARQRPAAAVGRLPRSLRTGARPSCLQQRVVNGGLRVQRGGHTVRQRRVRGLGRRGHGQRAGQAKARLHGGQQLGQVC
jgi:hypothetical protein